MVFFPQIHYERIRTHTNTTAHVYIFAKHVDIEQGWRGREGESHSGVPSVCTGEILFGAFEHGNLYFP